MKMVSFPLLIYCEMLPERKPEIICLNKEDKNESSGFNGWGLFVLIDDEVLFDTPWKKILPYLIVMLQTCILF